MCLCRLCKSAEADKKGSHIIPHFLFKRVVNVEGETGRDYELGFRIEEFETHSFFGRSLLPKHLDPVFGELSDDDIENNTIDAVVDNYFCSRCESRLAVIESEYSKTLDNVSREDYESGVTTELGLLFWASIIWRMSIQGNNGVTLREDQNEKLRYLLDVCLPDSIKDLNIETIRKTSAISATSYKLIRCPNFSPGNNTVILFHPDFSNPYIILLDEYILLFAFDNDYSELKRNSFFGVRRPLESATINAVANPEIIHPITGAIMLNILAGVMSRQKENRFVKYDDFFDTLWREMGGFGPYMPRQIKREILVEMGRQDKKTGRKFNVDDLRKSTFKVMSKYDPVEE